MDAGIVVQSWDGAGAWPRSVCVDTLAASCEGKATNLEDRAATVMPQLVADEKIAAFDTRPRAGGGQQKAGTTRRWSQLMSRNSCCRLVCFCQHVEGRRVPLIHTYIIARCFCLSLADKRGMADGLFDRAPNEVQVTKIRLVRKPHLPPVKIHEITCEQHTSKLAKRASRNIQRSLGEREREGRRTRNVQ